MGSAGAARLLVVDAAPAPPAVVEDERSLVERARTDRDAFALLYRRYVDRIHGFAFRRTGSRQLAEDVTSATFERALRSLPGFRWRGGGFGPWLFRIAANELADHYRRERRAAVAMPRLLSRPVDPDDDLSPDAIPELMAALGTLHPRYQHAISLRFLAGLSHDEAAAAMGCSKPVMAVTLHRALGALRRTLERGGMR